ncbi:hypothetical protein FB45DRAFT_361118 [Roridomyces roridus]|uniref:F-box domain-containing protein n=1 Tax=Roridomyces roridus TaxID=1738132 RepID=A0AAD7C812_9AGAR|nr:hypothetical protein FB45DRAFT_361118 [Roridomyces roridus]
MSVLVELEAQIDLVSKDIERQKQVLKTLESNRSLLQRQLNTLRDPIARLPLEISSQIFVQCLPPGSPAVPDGHQVPMLLLNVCNAWTDIALSTTDLWTKIHFTLPRNQAFGRLLAIWLGRARTNLSHVSVKGPMHSGIATQIFRHSSHLGHLELAAEDGQGDDDDFIEFRDLLEGVLPESLPALHTFVIRSGRRTLQVAASPILQILRLAPNLTELEFDAVETVGGTANDLVVLSSLRRLSLSMESQQYIGSQSKILGYISAPQLATLCLHHDLRPSAEDHRSILTFLERSSPPLHTLVSTNPGDCSCLDDILPLVPTLTDLRVQCPGPSGVDRVCTLLGQTQPTAVPNLRALLFTHVHNKAGAWDAVVQALSARRTQIKTLRMEFRSSVIPIPPNALTALKEFSAEGMDIWIGIRPSGQNRFLDL